MSYLKTVVFLIILFLSGIKTKAQKNIPNDSTVGILKEWITVISADSFMNYWNIRGISKEMFATNLKLMNLSVEDYQKGKYRYAFEDMHEIGKIETVPEVKRIQLFIFTMAQIKLNKHFKARKWYYVSKTKIKPPDFARLKKNVDDLKLPYKIDNYRQVRGARLIVLGIGAGILFIAGNIGGG